MPHGRLSGGSDRESLGRSFRDFLRTGKRPPMVAPVSAPTGIPVPRPPLDAKPIPKPTILTKPNDSDPVSPGLIDAMIHRESRGDPNAVSSAGAIGLMQLMPDTARGLGVDPRDPVQNVEGGTRYIRNMFDRFDGDAELALMAYNWGPGNVSKWVRGGRKGRVPRETKDYVKNLLPFVGTASKGGTALTK